MDFNSIFDRNARLYAGKAVLYFSDSSIALSHVQIRDLSQRLALWMLTVGVKRGDRVGIWMGNVCEFALAVAACMRIGAAAVPFSIFESVESIEAMCRESNCRLLMYDGKNKHIERRIRQSFSPRHVQAIDISRYGTPDTIRLDFIPADLPDHRIHCRRNSGEEAFLLFTSGSTGEKKPVSIPLASIAGFQLSRTLFDLFACLYPLRFFSMFPWYHISGIHRLFSILCGHNEFCCTADHFSPVSATKALAAHRITVWQGTATMLSRCCVFRHSAEFRLPPIVITAGEAVSRHVLDVLEKHPGASIMVATYGSTEISGISNLLYHFSNVTPFFRFASGIIKPLLQIRHTYSFRDFDTDNRVFPLGDSHSGLQTAIWDEETNNLLPDGCPGEIIVHSRQLASRYARSKSDNLFIKLGGKLYVRTGDLGFQRGRRLYMIGRKKNLIIRSGENIVPAGIEQAAMHQPCVQSAIACGIPSKTHGEDICLCLEGDPAAIDLAAMKQHLENTLPRYMIPQHIDVFREFPVGETGKTSVRTLREIMCEKYPIQ